MTTGKDDSGVAAESERFDRREEIFSDALELAPEGRDAFVRERAAGDEALAGDVLAMLAADESHPDAGRVNLVEIADRIVEDERGSAAESERFDRLEEIFCDAIELASSEREAFVREKAASDETLARDVLAMLTEHASKPDTGRVNLVEIADRIVGDTAYLGEGGTGVELDLDLIGETVAGKYRIERLLGHGGMGTVFEVTHLGIERVRALKILHAAAAVNPQMRSRFILEAKALGKLDHPNIVTVFDSGLMPDSSGIYIEMERLVGRSLADRLEHGPAPSIAEAVEIGRQVLAALDESHRNGIIHRDVKPANIFLCDDREGICAKVLDFGIAKVTEGDQASRGLTRTGEVFGTLSYMSRERLARLPGDERSDLYSVGVVLYEMIAGHVPYEIESPVAVGARQVPGVVRPLDQANRECPPKLARVVERLLEREAADRYESAEEAARAICRAMRIRDGFGAWDGEWEDTEGPGVRRRRRHSSIRTAAIAAAVCLAVWLAVWAAIPRPATEPPDPPARPAGILVFERDFVEIPGGEVRIGLDPQVATATAADLARDPKLAARRAEIFAPAPDEMPAHAVTLAPYYICRHEVTRGEYAEFLAATGRQAPPSWKGSTPQAGSEELPVTEVTWDDARAYAAWRAERDRIPYRLPTEAEWEHAARGPDGNLWPWGNAWEANRAYADLAVEAPMPVSGDPTGTRDRSPFGVTGLAGNVSEWTADEIAPYPQSSMKIAGPDAGMKVFRGGRFASVPDSCRTTFRQWLRAETRDPRIGFRLASSVPPS